MAEIDFLALIEQGAESWNRWRADHPTVQPDLRTAYLFGQALSGFDLSEANLERACLISADLRGANLSKACLQSVYASKADLSEADLREADLSLGNFGEADFSGAILSDIRARGTNFAQACFTGATLANWQIDPTTTLQDLRGSHLCVKQQRKPRSGEFRPGELAALIRRLSVGAANAKSSPFFSFQKLLKGPARRPSVLIGTGLTAAIALTALTATFRSNLLSAPPAGQSPARADQGDSISLPCEEAPLTTLLTNSAAHQYQNGAIYYGKFVDGNPADGKGTMVYPSGNRYDGEYKNGYRNGCGTFTFSNGRRYIGQFETDQFNGKGTWILENGERYIGEFENNRCSGTGTFIFLNGSSKSGVWEEGKLLDGDLSCDQSGLDLPVSSSQ
ncbi:MAG: pentapeptide repeat-containing protein [Phormidesmis sp.]